MKLSSSLLPLLLLLLVLSPSSSSGTLLSPTLVTTLTPDASSLDYLYGYYTSFDGEFLAISSDSLFRVLSCPTLSSCVEIFSAPLANPSLLVKSPYVFAGDFQASGKVFVYSCSSATCVPVGDVDSPALTDLFISGSSTFFAFSDPNSFDVTLASCNAGGCAATGSITGATFVVDVTVDADRVAVAYASGQVIVYAGCTTSCTAISTLNILAPGSQSMQLSGQFLAIADSNVSPNVVRVYDCAGNGCPEIAELAGTDSYVTLSTALSFKANILAVTNLKFDLSSSRVDIYVCSVAGCEFQGAAYSVDSPATDFGGVVSVNNNKLAVVDRFFNAFTGKVYLYNLNACPYNADYAHVTWNFTDPGVLANGDCVSGWSGNPIRQCNANGEWASLVKVHCIRNQCPPDSLTGNAAFATTNSLTWRVGTCNGGVVGPAPFRFCNADGTWGPVQRPCTIVGPNCNAESYAHVDWNPTAPGSFGTGTCLIGSGTPQRYCDYAGVWASAVGVHCT